MRVMMFAPHPDDEVIGCGGSLINWHRAGAEVSTVFLTSGDAGVAATPRAAAGPLREDEARAAGRVLGTGDPEFLRQPDGCLAETPALMTRLIELIRSRRPHLVYLPHSADAHPDHLATHHLVRKAVATAGTTCWPEAGGDAWTVGTELGYEVWSAISRPGYLEDVTDVQDDALAALAQHRSQLEDVPYDQRVRGLAAFRGAWLGRGRHAEAFEVLRLSGLPGAHAGPVAGGPVGGPAPGTTDGPAPRVRP
ncbi:PIG-L family deacetylase [Spirillospora sp. NBC_00431]